MLDPVQPPPPVLVRTYVRPARVYHRHSESPHAIEVASLRGGSLGTWVELSLVDDRYRCPECGRSEGGGKA